MVDGNDTSSEIAPEIIIKPQDVEVVKGADQTTLDCIANARPLHLLETLWYKDGILIENSGVLYTFNDVWNRSLTLISANLTHTGMYECHVTLRTGEFPTVVAAAQVLVQEKPQFVSNSKTETLGDYGSQVNLPCDAVGIPIPNVTWYKDAQRIDFETDRRYFSQQQLLSMTVIETFMKLQRLCILDK